MDNKKEISALIKQILDEEYVGWKAPVLPGNAEKGAYLVANEDFIDPPLDVSNKTVWYKPDTNPEPGPTPGEDYVKSVNSKTPDADGDVELKASDIKANNTQSIQANLERIDEAVEGAIDDIADLEANKQHKLIAGSNITITPGEDGDTISATGGSGGGVEKVCNVSPDASGNVALDASNIPYGPSSNVQTTLNNLSNNKVDKVTGKGLSTNDYSTAEKNKVALINSTDTLKFTLADSTTVTVKVVTGA